MLVLVVGASGAGKDTLLAAARSRFGRDERIVFARRVITRPEAVGEDHAPLSRREFDSMRAGGGFLLSWEAHGNAYGISARHGDDLQAGRLVVVNASRAVIGDAARQWPHTRVVHVTVPIEVAKERLIGRGREGEGELTSRFARLSVSLPGGVPIDEVDNGGDIADAVAKFFALLEAYLEHASSGSR
jgi:phosphonate metabolism protein PhnN/1,5-bisphosphokinase (PRPP-forming)